MELQPMLCVREASAYCILELCFTDLTWICGGGTVDAFCDAHHALDVPSTPLTQLGRFPDAKQRLYSHLPPLTVNSHTIPL